MYFSNVSDLTCETPEINVAEQVLSSQTVCLAICFFAWPLSAQQFLGGRGVSPFNLSCNPKGCIASELCA